MSKIAISFEHQEVVSSARVWTLLTPTFDRFEVRCEADSALVEISLVKDNVRRVPIGTASWDLGGIVFTQSFLPAAGEGSWPDYPNSITDAGQTESETALPVRAAQYASMDYLGLGTLSATSGDRIADEEVLTLLLPQGLLRQEPGVLDGVQRAIVNSGLGSVLADYMMALAHRLPTVARTDLGRLKSATCALVGACFAATADQAEVVETPMASALLDRVRREVRQNMASVDFGPDALCKLLSVSRSKLYRMFESRGGVARFIQRERLTEAHRRLSESEHITPIKFLATDVGFVDHATFSRAFKREFGYSPSEARKVALVKASRAAVFFAESAA